MLSAMTCVKTIRKRHWSVITAIKSKTCAFPRLQWKTTFVDMIMTIAANAMMLIFVAVLPKVRPNVIDIRELGSCFQLNHPQLVQVNHHHPTQVLLLRCSLRRAPVLRHQGHLPLAQVLLLRIALQWIHLPWRFRHLLRVQVCRQRLFLAVAMAGFMYGTQRLVRSMVTNVSKLMGCPSLKFIFYLKVMFWILTNF